MNQRAQNQAESAELPEKPTFLTPDYVATDLGFSIYTLRNWRNTQTGPPHVTVGGRTRYPSDLYDQWRAELLAAAK